MHAASYRLTTNLTTTQACDFLSLLYFGFSGGGKDDKPPCDPSWQAPYQQAPPGNISSLRDARPLPPAFSEDQAAELFAEEGQTYYWL